MPPATTDRLPSSRLTWAGIVLGLSLGGFFDGILFHQVLQWHHMLTSVEDPAIRNNFELNTLADGLFHAGTWVLAVIGLMLLWRARHDFGALASGRGFAGAVLMGAGLFNLIEGPVNHHLLGLHHVRTDSPNQTLWDLAFLGLGLALVAVGWAMRRSGAAVARYAGADRAH